MKHTATRTPPGERFAAVSARKARGATYTPPALADYLAARLVEASAARLHRVHLRVLDPCLGDGALAHALLAALSRATAARVELVAWETDPDVARRARAALAEAFPGVDVDVRAEDFLAARDAGAFDLAIANPPYVRTQILGAAAASRLASRFGLAGRVDLYQAFALASLARLAPGGGLALLTSNRFLTTKGGARLRDALADALHLHRVWDLGDTRAFDAAVLPAMLVGHRRDAPAPTSSSSRPAVFTSVYERLDARGAPCDDLARALDREGLQRVGERTFEVRHGALHAPRGDVWRLASPGIDAWLEAVRARTWRRLGELGRVRVGVKSTADAVFVRDDWERLPTGAPELLRPLITHHAAGRYRGLAPTRSILYPHVARDGGRAPVELADHPRAAAYLEAHRAALEARRYVREAGRRWYELWVPHDPAAWRRPKLVWRDIAARPTFWLDATGAVVHGDCYWLVTDDAADERLLWLALAVTNSTFVEAFYDRCFNNRLYAGRRRFMSQYVARFPLPDPATAVARELGDLARRRHDADDPAARSALEAELDARVWAAFGLDDVDDPRRAPR